MCMIGKGSGGDREMVNKREKFISNEDIIKYTHTPTIWPTSEKARVLEIGEAI